MASLDPEIFKAYDIRGLYGSQIDERAAELIGRAFARVLGGLAQKPVEELRIGLGRDMRLSAPELAERYREGMLAEGAQVIDAGQVGTEMLYYLVGSRELDGGLMCTASHNPKAYTGAKLVRAGALALSGEEGIQEIRRTIEQTAEQTVQNGGPARARARTRGAAEEIDLYDEFQRYVERFIDVPAFVAARAERPLKVVLDGGNGMAGPMVGPLLARLGLETIETYWTPDGSFPDHEPNPLLPENRELAIARVRESGADLGIAWDGDADRCFFIDDTGEFVDGDFLTALLARVLLEKSARAGHAQEAVLYDVRASRAVADTVREAGGVAHVNRVGHAFFKRRMRAEGSLFGGEVSGHYYFREFFCADSGSIPALLVLELVSKSGCSLAELLAPYRDRYFISGEINTEVGDQEAKMAQIAARYGDARQGRLDGISIDYEDWHFNVRPSNTEPLLRLCLESLVSRRDMERRRDEVLELIRS
ncbi:MAG TPA: phosphomannomutase/phosphoglucomutase [Solirubrobacteraceae bacterium]|nr:phosphomannomutase/phosphoglucomutase [Solirubrobacteraceae bacterium]